MNFKLCQDTIFSQKKDNLLTLMAKNGMFMRIDHVINLITEDIMRCFILIIEDGEVASEFTFIPIVSPEMHVYVCQVCRHEGKHIVGAVPFEWPQMPDDPSLPQIFRYRMQCLNALIKAGIVVSQVISSIRRVRKKKKRVQSNGITVVKTHRPYRLGPFVIIHKKPILISFEKG